MPANANVPLVSIVTPSLNQAAFLPETLRSVQGQSYSPIEHIVVDGGSTDESIEVLKEFQDRYELRWVSESDLGQSHALNKGFEMARGGILGWLNSDDIYLPGAVEAAVRVLEAEPEVHWVHGDAYVIDAEGRGIAERRPGPLTTREIVLNGMILVQPTLFFRSEVLREVGGLSEEVDTTMDEDFSLRLAYRYPGRHIARFQATRRHHQAAKSSRMSLTFCDDSLRSLDNFFSIKDLPPSLLGLRNEAYANRYAVCASSLFEAGMFAETRRYLLKSLKLNPRLWRRRVLIGLLLFVESLFGIRWIRPGRKRRRAAKKFEAKYGEIYLRWFDEDPPRFVMAPK